MRTVQLAGISFRPATLTAIQAAVEDSSQRTEPLVLGFVNPHVITVATQNRQVASHLQSCDLVCVDGIGVQLALRLHQIKTQRIPAHQLLDRLLDSGSLKGSLVVIGIEEELVASAASAIAARGDGLRLTAAQSGFASDEDTRRLLSETPDVAVVLIGAGSPRSETLANIARELCKHAVIFHCGAGSLAVYAGTRSHAPNWVNRAGFDWLYRFVREPHTRRRYTIGMAQFVRTVFAGSSLTIAPPQIRRAKS